MVRRHVLLTQALMVVLSTGLTLLGAELLLRAFGVFDLGIWGITREGLVVLRPNQCTEIESARGRVCANSLGMRDVEHSVPKPPGVFRVLVLGDSFMEALQIPLEDAFTRRLERQLDRHNPGRIEVINAGVSGWGTDDELAYLRTYGVRLQPDLVLVAMTLHNDLSDNLSAEWHELRDGRLVPRPVPLLSDFDYRRLQLQTFLAAHSQIYQALFRAWRARDFGAAATALDAQVSDLLAASPPPALAKGWVQTEALFDSLVQEANAMGAHTAVFLIPLWVQIDSERLAEFCARHGLESASLSIRGPQQRMIAWGSRAGVPIIDLQPAFAEHARGESLYIEGDGHWTAAGHRLAADEVGAQLESLRLLTGESA